MSGCILSIVVVCPYCDEDVILEYSEIGQDWEDFTCPTCSKSFQVKLDENNCVKVKTE